MRRILITGGAGFIGLSLARRLSAESGAQVTLADDLSRGRRDDDLEEVLRRGNVELLAADLTTPEGWAALGRGYDEVYHLAALLGVRNVVERPLDVLRVNALGAFHGLEWLVGGGGRRLLFASTSEAYAWTQHVLPLPIPTPEDVPLALTDLANPRASYAGSKIFAELAVTQFCRVHRIPFAIVRYHNVYGPRMGMDHVVPQLLERAVRGEDPLVVRGADHRRAFCFIDDAVEATIEAARRPEAEGRTFNVGNDLEECTIGALAERLLDLAGLKARVEPRPAERDPIVRRCPDLGLARKLLDYEPRVTLEAGLRQTIAWYRPRLMLEAPP